MKHLLPLVIFLLALTVSYAQQGKHGAKTVASTALVNEYASLTANATAGNTYVQVDSNGMNSHGLFATALAQGDLVMIIQMQGATINGAPNDSTWGEITNYNNCGLYEFSEVAGVSGSNTINLSCALKNNYTAAGKVQVVRVPRYTSLTINSGGNLSCLPWNGTEGGIIAIEVQGNTLINNGGSINANSKGFRGGAVRNNTSLMMVNMSFKSLTDNAGAEKGESVAGYQSDYNIYGGPYGRGAPANAGGGGNAWNSGGGGGGNAGSISAYTGNGNPDTTNRNWIRAWNLEYNGFAYSSSSGGGRGGYNVSQTNQDALTLGPNSTTWDAGFQRTNSGGKGGRPLDYSTGRIFFGGGGGAGTGDDFNAGGGGAGGGIVYILSGGTVSGAGVIQASGLAGGDANSTNGGSTNGDGSGGGGAGGTVIINSTGAISGISIQANGGKGGNQLVPGFGMEAEGPGGGGGGGYIALSNGTANAQANGGVHGTTNSPALTEFTANGATKGGAGVTNATIATVPFSTVAAYAGPDTSICAGATVPLLATGGATYNWGADTTLSCTACPNPNAAPLATTTYIVTVSNGTCSATDSVTVFISGAGGQAGTIIADDDSICTNSPGNLHLRNSLGAIQWQFSLDGNTFITIPGADSTSYQANILQTTYFRVYAGSGACADTSAPFTLVVNPVPVPPLISASDTLICSSDSSSICVPPGYASYTWNTGDTARCIHTRNAGGYWVTVTATGGCQSVSGRAQVKVYPVPSVSIVVRGDTLSSFNAVTYQWYLDDNAITGATLPMYIATQSGYYSVEITDTNGCRTISSQVYVEVTGIAEVGIKGIKVYPNPASAVVNIDFTGSAHTVYSVSMFNTLGESVAVQQLKYTQGRIAAIDISTLQRGIYFLQLQSAQQTWLHKVVVQ